MIRNWFRGVVEAAIIRLEKTGQINVTVKHVTMASAAPKGCAACKGSGRAAGGFSGKMKLTGDVTSREREDMMFLSQGVCLACRGKG